jgi:hypothetical protein
MVTKAQKAECEDAIERLRTLLQPGDIVYTILRHVSRSGMRRVIDAVIQTENGLMPIGWLIARALGDRFDHDHGGVVVGGCGMDMGYHLVYAVGHALWPKGHGCAGEKCPSNEHTNGDRDRTPHSEVRPHWHSDGGYALKQRWL